LSSAKTAARRFLALPAHSLAAEERAEICRETLRCWPIRRFAELWGADAQAEVPVVGLIGGHALSGQIDRLVVTPERVLNRRLQDGAAAAGHEDEVPANLSAPAGGPTRRRWRASIPTGGHVCVLVDEGPRLMPISPARLIEHLP